MKAIGAKSRFILALFLSEALIIGLLGSTLGLLTGVAGAYVLTSGMLGSEEEAEAEEVRQDLKVEEEEAPLTLLLSSFQMIF